MHSPYPDFSQITDVSHTFNPISPSPLSEHPNHDSPGSSLSLSSSNVFTQPNIISCSPPPHSTAASPTPSGSSPPLHEPSSSSLTSSCSSPPLNTPPASPAATRNSEPLHSPLHLYNNNVNTINNNFGYQVRYPGSSGLPPAAHASLMRPTTLRYFSSTLFASSAKKHVPNVRSSATVVPDNVAHHVHVESGSEYMSKLTPSPSRSIGTPSTFNQQLASSLNSPLTPFFSDGIQIAVTTPPTTPLPSPSSPTFCPRRGSKGSGRFSRLRPHTLKVSMSKSVPNIRGFLHSATSKRSSPSNNNNMNTKHSSTNNINSRYVTLFCHKLTKCTFNLLFRKLPPIKQFDFS